MALLKRFCVFTFFVLMILTPISAQTLSVPSDEMAADFLIQGFDAFQNNDWTSALFFLRKAVSLPDASSAEVWYMLVMSEMFAEEYDAAIKDGEFFCSFYPDSPYRPYVDYQIGRAMHYIGDYDGSIKRLGVFCAKNPHHEMYSSGLFWMAESLFATFYFDLAKPIYQRIVTEYPNSAKYTESQYRIDLISQREREEKLLYLLKVTGEEYLSSKEDYERQLKQYQTEETLGLRKEIKDLNEELHSLRIRYDEAEREKLNATDENDNLLKQNELLENEISALKVANESLIVELAIANESLNAANESLAKITADLETTTAALDTKTKELEAKNEELKSKEFELDSKTVELKSKTVELKSANEELESKTVELESKKQELEDAKQDMIDNSLKDEMRYELEKLKQRALDIQSQLDTEKIHDNTKATESSVDSSSSFKGIITEDSLDVIKIQSSSVYDEAK